MHRSVLQNKGYIQFAEENTVEVMSLSGLETGIQRKDPRAATYERKDEDGRVRAFLVEYPSLTVEDIQALRRSPAPRYNEKGTIPHTAIVDPWTLEKIRDWNGAISAGVLQEAVLEARKQLAREHESVLRRRDWRQAREAARVTRTALAAGELDEALRALAGHRRLLKGVPRDRLGPAHTGLGAEVAEALRFRLGSLRRDLKEDGARARNARREWKRLEQAARGSGLEALLQEGAGP